MQCLLQLRGERKADPLYWAFTISLDRHLDRDVFRPVADIAPVFAKASRTICWLGTPSPPSLGASAFDLIPTLCQARRAVLKDVASPKKMQSCGFDKVDPISILGEYQRLTNSVRPEAWQSMEELLRMRFFSRSWILMEILSAQQLVVQCGSAQVPWDDLCFALEACDLYKCPSPIKSDGLQMLLAAQAARRLLSIRPSRARRLVGIFAALDTPGVDAENPQDKILGANSIVRVKSTLRARYGGRSADDVSSTNTLNAFNIASQILNAILERPFTLSLARSADPALNPNWPSWIPNWGVPRQRYLLDSPAECFRASTVEQRNMPFLAGSRLRFAGLAVGTVRATAGYLPPRRHCDHYTASGGNSIFLGQWFEWAEEVSSRLRPIFPSRDPDRTLLEFVETIQAKGCDWKFATAMPVEHERYLAQARKFLDFLEDEDIEETYDIKLFYAACYPSHDRTFGITSNGRFCLLPKGAKAGDVICIPHGNKVPVVLRNKGDYYHNLGESYVHGLMYGEAYAIVGLETQRFVIR
ncbi:HET domain-containing protein [Fusarium keratoplasticum]|nr:HET domain-containing protein [Fusarium keratoplasticum]